MLWRQRDPDAGRDIDLIAVDFEWLRHELDDPVCERARSLALVIFPVLKIANSSPPSRASTSVSRSDV